MLQIALIARPARPSPFATLAILTAILLACSVLGGFLPGPTERPVTPADIAGAYTYAAGDRVVSVTLDADGAFSIADTAGMAASGTWSLDGADIRLEFLPSSAPPEGIGGWYVYDTEDGGFAIMGGEGDPDAWPGLQRAE